MAIWKGFHIPIRGIKLTMVLNHWTIHFSGMILQVFILPFTTHQGGLPWSLASGSYWWELSLVSIEETGETVEMTWLGSKWSRLWVGQRISSLVLCVSFFLPCQSKWCHMYVHNTKIDVAQCQQEIAGVVVSQGFGSIPKTLFQETNIVNIWFSGKWLNSIWINYQEPITYR